MRKGFLFFIFLSFFSSGQAAKPLTIGALPYYPPFDIQADKQNHFFGFDIDIMNAVCQRLKRECNYVPLYFENMQNALNKNEIDLAIGAIVITQQRREYVQLSLPYLPSEGLFFTNKSAPFHSPSDLSGKTVGTLNASVYLDVTERMFNGNVTIKAYEKVPTMVQALINGDIDAAIIDEHAARYWQSTNSDNLKILGKAFKIGDGYGIAAALKNPELISLVNEALLSIQNDGTLLKIYNDSLMD